MTLQVGVYTVGNEAKLASLDISLTLMSCLSGDLNQSVFGVF